MKAMAGIISFCESDSGAIAAEHGILIAFISLVILLAVASFGSAVKETLYDDLISKFPKAR